MHPKDLHLVYQEKHRVWQNKSFAVIDEQNEHENNNWMHIICVSNNITNFIKLPNIKFKIIFEISNLKFFKKT